MAYDRIQSAVSRLQAKMNANDKIKDGEFVVLDGSPLEKAIENNSKEVRKMSMMLTDLSKLYDIDKSVKANKVEIPKPEPFPSSIKISNLKDIPRPFMPDKLKVTNPKDFDWGSEQLEIISKKLDNIKFPTKAKDAIPVRLSDGKKFYKMLSKAVAEGSGNAMRIIGGGSGTNAFVKSDGSPKQGLVDNDGHVQVDIQTMPDVSIDPTGLATDTKQDTIIGHIDGIEALLGTIDADTGAIKTAVETIDNAISGSEMQVDVVGALPAGTNSIGSVTYPDVDASSHSNLTTKYYTSATPTDGIIWSPAAGKRWHVHTLAINVSAASTVTIEDDLTAGDNAVYKAELAANSGVVLTFPEKYPLASAEDAADLTVTASAGTVYVTAHGYEI